MKFANRSHRLRRRRRSRVFARRSVGLRPKRPHDGAARGSWKMTSDFTDLERRYQKRQRTASVMPILADRPRYRPDGVLPQSTTRESRLFARYDIALRESVHTACASGGQGASARPEAHSPRRRDTRRGGFDSMISPIDFRLVSVRNADLTTRSRGEPAVPDETRNGFLLGEGAAFLVRGWDVRRAAAARESTRSRRRRHRCELCITDSPPKGGPIQACVRHWRKPVRRVAMEIFETRTERRRP